MKLERYCIVFFFLPLKYQYRCCTGPMKIADLLFGSILLHFWTFVCIKLAKRVFSVVRFVGTYMSAFGMFWHIVVQYIDHTILFVCKLYCLCISTLPLLIASSHHAFVSNISFLAFTYIISLMRNIILFNFSRQFAIWEII